jgi:D-alanyl-lipoteichoic acid acyltransferase DltB (MBOAT superfamily)
MLNFNLPYFATSPSDFWRRWHISLSTWLRDYLYIGLGGNRGGELRTYRNLFLTLLLGGLWHGASWTFVAWGAYHGLLLIAYRLLGIRTEGRGTPWSLRLPMGLLMFHLTCVGWLLFRAQNMETVRVFLEAIVTSAHLSPAAWEVWHQLVYYGWFLFGFQVLQGLSGTLDPLPRLPWLARLTVWVFVVMSILRLAPRTAQEFIYFAF